MFSKVFKPLAILFVLAAFCFLGYTVSTSADGKGYRCEGDIGSKWDPSCAGHAQKFCSAKQGTQVAFSTKKCVQASSSDYCKIKQTAVMDGSGSCKWNQKNSACENPSINTSVNKDNC